MDAPEQLWQRLHDEDCPGHTEEHRALFEDGIRSSRLVCQVCFADALRAAIHHTAREDAEIALKTGASSSYFDAGKWIATAILKAHGLD